MDLGLNSFSGAMQCILWCFLGLLCTALDEGDPVCACSRARGDLTTRQCAPRRLLEMIGTSRQIYKGMVELLRVRWTASVQDARGKVSLDTEILTSLRRHLLMALQSKGVQQVDRCGRRL
jgi:hypothetical protein